MPMVWNDAADAKLFAAVIATHKEKLDYQALANIMGPGCTAKAITHRIAKLRDIAKGFDADNPNSTSASPKKRVKKDENAASPAKKPKRGPKAKKEAPTEMHEKTDESDEAVREADDENGVIKGESDIEE